MMLVSIGDQVEEGTYQFHSRFNRAVNFTQGDHLVSIVDEAIGDGPLNIVLRNFDAGQTQYPLAIFARKVVFEGREISFTSRHRYRSTLDCRPGPRFRDNLSIFGRLLATTSHPKSLAFLLDDRRTENFRAGFERTFAAQVKQSVSKVFHGDRLDGVRTLSGCGIGLTPSGDDFIAGLLIALHLRGETVDDIFEAARSDNIFSNSFLNLARQGRLFGRMKNLILALMHGDDAAVREATRRLLAIGESSGADLGTGFYITIRAS